MHIDEAWMQRFAHGELDPHEERTVRVHLSECEECAAGVHRIADEESEVDRLLAHLDHRPPAITAADVIASAPAAPTRAWLRAALVPFLLVGLAGAAFALPGSPLRTWVAGRASSDAPGPAGTEAEAGSAGVAGRDPSGLFAEPGPSLAIVFERPAPSSIVVVSLFEGDVVEATALDGSATFTSGQGSITISGGDAHRFAVRIPQHAPRVEIRVGSRTVFLRQGDMVSADLRADSTGIWTIPLSPAQQDVR